MRSAVVRALLAGLCLQLGAGAADAQRSGDMPADRGAPARDGRKMWQEALAGPSLAVTGAFDEHGRLWTVSIRDRHLHVSHSDDLGATFSAPVTVNAEPESILGDGENRPKIAVRKGIVYVSYTRGLEKPMTGDIRFSRSLDGGKTFPAPVTVNDNHDVISHRFEALAVADNGDVHLAWLDKRDLHAAQARGAPYRGAALYYAVSRDGGASFGANRKLADSTCECCRVAMALDGDGTPVVAWRHIFGRNLRDHALLRMDGVAALTRLSREQWAIDACPHHGPALSIGPDNVYHAAWFSNAPGGQGLFYARSGDRGAHFDAPLAFGDNEAQAGHPAVLGMGQAVYLAWKEFDGRNTVVRLMRSADGGRRFGAARTTAATAGRSDHPELITDGKRVFVAWNTAREGLRLIEATAP